MIELEDRGVIFDASKQPPSRKVAFFTSLVPLRSGKLLCGFQVGPAKHHPTSTTSLACSVDLGRTWREMDQHFSTTIEGRPGSLSGGELVEVTPGRLLLFTTWFDRSDPARPLFDPDTNGLLHSKQLVAESLDEGETWSPWRIIDTPGLTGCAMTGPVLCWSESLLAFPFESFKDYNDPAPARHAAWMLVSRDGGQTFCSQLQIAQHPRHEIYYWDQRLCSTSAAGDFVAVFWTHDLTHQRDLTIHLRHGRIEGDHLALEEIIDTGIPGQIAAPLKLPTGQLLAFVVDRDRPGTMRLWLSEDRGQSWPIAQSQVIYSHDELAKLSQGKTDINFQEYWEDMAKWTFGHPAARLLPDGRVLLAWYAGQPGELSLHWARVRID